MAEALARKKRIRAGHKASVTKSIRNVEEILAREVPSQEKLSMLEMTLKEKLGTMKTLDAEVTDLIEDEKALGGEIE